MAAPDGEAGTEPVTHRDAKRDRTREPDAPGPTTQARAERATYELGLLVLRRHVEVRELLGEARGHHRAGRELVSDLIDVDVSPLAFSVQGRCAYESTFEYSSDHE